MKKITKTIVALILALVTVLSLTACSSYPKLKKAFVKEGYAESESVEKVVDSIKEDFEKDKLAVECHLLSKGISFVLICEFSTTDDMAKAFNDSETMQGLIKDAKKNDDLKAVYSALEDTGLVKGNCLVIPISIINTTEVVKIVKNA
ncbi:MAG: hypothetical protein MJ066_01700 [Clostridia bacterium]|nr:hypothetical protein [Clostridia bacterium]